METSSLEKDNLTFMQGVKDCIPTILGYMSIGIAAGVVGVSSNLSVFEVFLLSTFVYAGASQFIICALLVAGSPIAFIFFTTFIVNLRHLLLSMTLAPNFSKYSLFNNVGIGALVTDESFGVATHQLALGKTINDRWMHGLNFTAYTCWILSCVVGAIFGKWIANPEVFGLDFALTAMFIALLVLQLDTLKKSKLKLYLSLILYVIVLMVLLCTIFPSYIAVIISTVIVATIGVLKDK